MRTSRKPHKRTTTRKRPATRHRASGSKRRTQSRTLTDHDEIRDWAEQRDANPAHVTGTGGDGDIGMIRLDFPGYSGEGKLQSIAWDEWFEKFDESNLALVVQDKTSDGEVSNFNKLVAREGSGRRPRRRATQPRARTRARTGGGRRASAQR